MDTIKFVIEHYEDAEAGYRFPVINIYINEQNLIDLVSRVERKNWDGDKSTRSSYIGYEVSHFQRFRREMLGEKTYPRSILLTCTCTYAECSCIMATIVIHEATVTWSDLISPWLSGPTPSPWIEIEEAESMGWQPLDYSGLGPFVFAWDQYLSALDQVTQECQLQDVPVNDNVCGGFFFCGGDEMSE